MDNPWKVDTVQAFLCLKCPECDFYTREDRNFKDHAICNHPLSYVLFQKSLFGKPVVENTLEVFVNEDKMIDIKEEKIDIDRKVDICDKDFQGSVEKRLNFSDNLSLESDQTLQIKEEPIETNREDMMICDRNLESVQGNRLDMKNGKFEKCDKTLFVRRTDTVDHIFDEKESNDIELTPYFQDNPKISFETTLKNHIDSKHKLGQQHKENSNTSSTKKRRAKNPFPLKRGPIKSQYKCKDCDFICKSKHSLNRHIAMVHEQKKSSNLYFNCTNCGDGYSSKKALEDHNLKGHVKKISFQCYKCEFCGSNQKQLAIHMEIVHGENIHPFECFICNAKFLKNTQYKLHMTLVHEVKNPHKCSYCGESFSLEQHLETHIGIVHEKKKSYDCYLCNLKFLGKSDLNGHIASVHDKTVCDNSTL